MNIVAITQLATSLDDAAAAIAALLGTLPYEARLVLRAGLPAVVLATPYASRASVLVTDLRARGHTVLACDDKDVVASTAMTSLRRFRFDDQALIAITELGEIALPWIDIAALFRATHRTQLEKTQVVKGSKFALARTIATGGLVMSKTTKQTIVTRTDDSEPVLYLFRCNGQPPWILGQNRAHFGALGDRIAPTAAPNFTLAVELLRARASLARFDDRLVARKTTVEELDLLVHLLAMAIASGA